MKHTFFTICSAFSLLAAAMPVAAQNQNTSNNQNNQSPGEVVIAQNINVEATIQSIDRKNHKLTLKDADGNTFHVKVGPQMKNFNELKKGDNVMADLYESTAVSIQKPGTPSSQNTESQKMVTIPSPEQGAPPTRVMVDTRQITATIQNIDQKNHSVTLKGSDGKTTRVKVDPQSNDLSQLQVGDEVVADVTDAVGLSIEPKSP